MRFNDKMEKESVADKIERTTEIGSYTTYVVGQTELPFGCEGYTLTNNGSVKKGSKMTVLKDPIVAYSYALAHSYYDTENDKTKKDQQETAEEIAKCLRELEGLSIRYTVDPANYQNLPNPQRAQKEDEKKAKKAKKETKKVLKKMYKLMDSSNRIRLEYALEMGIEIDQQSAKRHGISSPETVAQVSKDDYEEIRTTMQNLRGTLSLYGNTKAEFVENAFKIIEKEYDKSAEKQAEYNNELSNQQRPVTNNIVGTRPSTTTNEKITETHYNNHQKYYQIGDTQVPEFKTKLDSRPKNSYSDEKEYYTNNPLTALYNIIANAEQMDYGRHTEKDIAAAEEALRQLNDISDMMEGHNLDGKIDAVIGAKLGKINEFFSHSGKRMITHQYISEVDKNDGTIIFKYHKGDIMTLDFSASKFGIDKKEFVHNLSVQVIEQMLSEKDPKEQQAILDSLSSSMRKEISERKSKREFEQFQEAEEKVEKAKQEKEEKEEKEEEKKTVKENTEKALEEFKEDHQKGRFYNEEWYTEELEKREGWVYDAGLGYGEAVTERKEAEEKLQQAKENLEQIKKDYMDNSLITKALKEQEKQKADSQQEARSAGGKR